MTGKTFDNGLLCSSPNSVVVENAVADELRRALVAGGAYFLSPAEANALTSVLITPQRLPNPALVGRPATVLAERAGIRVPSSTRVLIAELGGVGRDYPLSIEKLCPVLSYYVVADWREGCERCKQILRYGGMGHTMSIHSRDERIILEFGLKKPAFRIVVNTPTTHGSIGLTTGLDPAMTLGCGGYGGNITSDNISPRHLLNIKRLAYELRPAPRAGSAAPPATPPASMPVETPMALPKVASLPVTHEIEAAAIRQELASYLSGRGRSAPAAATPSRDAAASAAVAEFVCEEDVRHAIAQGRTILVGERTIITPSARDLGEARRVFVLDGWPRR
jgi:acetaldehyde dehydrogenase (acetylating)